MARIALAEMWPCFQRQSHSVYALYGHSDTLANGLVQEIQEGYKGVTVEALELADVQGTLQTPLLFGKHPSFVWVPSGWSWNARSDHVMSTWPTWCPLIVRAATCPPSWSKSPVVGAVACYECSIDESRRIFNRYIARMDIKLSSEVLEWCAYGTVKGDWKSWSHTLSLLDKDSRESLSVVQALFDVRDDTSSLALFSQAKPVLGDTESVKLIRSWQRGLVQVWYIKQGLQQGLSERQALTSVTPPIFFKHESTLLTVAKKWSCAKIGQLLQRCMDVEVDIKKQPDFSHEWLMCLWKTATLGRV